MNIVLQTGRLAKDPELTALQSGKMVCKFTIVNDHAFKKDDKGKPIGVFHNCEVWGKTAEFVNQWFKKGKAIEIRGRLNTESYEVEGQKRWKTFIEVDSAHFALTEKATEKTEPATGTNTPDHDIPNIDPANPSKTDDVPF